VVILALKQVFDHDEAARKTPMSAQKRLVYHQTYSGPIMTTLKAWMKKQFEEREVEPNSSLGKAFNDLLGHWETLTRFLHVPGAPLDNNTAERALKLLIRQRKNSLFYATDHSAYVASLLISLMATCVQASVNAMDYLVVLQENRTGREPGAGSGHLDKARWRGSHVSRWSGLPDRTALFQITPIQPQALGHPRDGQHRC
jgi:transposase